MMRRVDDWEAIQRPVGKQRWEGLDGCGFALYDWANHC
jgi:hypothetical protein